VRTLKLLVASALMAMPSTALRANETNHFGETLQEIRHLCLDVILPVYPPASLGDCISFSLTFGTYGYAEHECIADRELDPDFDLNWGTFANCVHVLHGDTV